MKKFLVVDFEGVNYYAFTGTRTVNMTFDDVNEENYAEVSDFNCFTVKEDILTKEGLKADILNFLALND